jgi:hypothetical protein
MNNYSDDNGEPIRFCLCDEEDALLALHDAYREVGLSAEDARRSALADFEHNFGPAATCAA